MKKNWIVVAMLATGMSFYCTIGASQLPAQGPAGVGATSAPGSAAKDNTGSSGGHSMNPIKWVKKDKHKSSGGTAAVDQDKALTAKLQAAGVLPPDAELSSTCAAFKNRADCLAALHASHNLGLDFNCVRADVSGVLTGTDVAACKGGNGDKGASLADTIHALKPEADAKAEAKAAQKQAAADLKS